MIDMKLTVCETDMCNGCMACVACCPSNAIKIQDDVKAYNAVISTDACLECGLCKQVCPNITIVSKCKPIQWYQGWCNDSEKRNIASSGGVAGDLARSFIRLGGVVCSCVFEQGEFKFIMVDREEELDQFSGSKYVKSNPEDAYQLVKEAIKKGQQVLFLGLPCQVAGIKNSIPESKKKDLYTVDMVCHGTPSPKVLNLFLEENGYCLSHLKDIKFRTKGKVPTGYQKMQDVGMMDSYSLAFLNSLSLTENCYHCQFARVERVGDVTLGDSWGSKLIDEEKRKGISLILCQSEKGERLVESAELQLEKVDLKKAIQCNQQLNASSIKPKERDIFFSLLEMGRFRKGILRCLTKEWMKQTIKRVLIKIGIYRNYSEVVYGIVVCCNKWGEGGVIVKRKKPLETNFSIGKLNST